MEINKIYYGDCVDVLAEMEPNCIDLVVTSPPYNCGIKYVGYDDNKDWQDYYRWCKKWLKGLYRVLKEDGRCCINHYLSLGQSGNRHAPLMKINEIAEHVGFKHHGLAIWWDITLTKRTAWGSWLSASAPYINSPFEGILILYKNRWKKDNKGTTQISKEEFMESCSGVWKIPTERNRSFPAPFPVALPARCIKLLSNEGDLVLDPFMGSGTTLVAAKELNRRYVGIDISEEYCKMTNKRMEEGK